VASIAVSLDPVDCTTPYAKPRDDVDAFMHGYIVQTDDVALPVQG
jgi:hypothetical protein